VTPAADLEAAGYLEDAGMTEATVVRLREVRPRVANVTASDTCSACEDAALVWGAVCAAEESRGFRMLMLERRRYEEHLTRLEQSTAWRSGRALTLHDAFAALGDS